MRTKNAVSTISYNSIPFLLDTLSTLVNEGIVEDWIFIRHDPEVDEKKAHIHLWLRLCRLTDTQILQSYFEESDPFHPDKPLKCISFQSTPCDPDPTGIDNWIPYSMHYAPYLAIKGEAREFHYSIEDFTCMDPDSFDFWYQHAMKGSKWAKDWSTLQVLRQKRFNPADLILSGSVPLNMAGNLRAFTNLCHLDRLERGDHFNHEEEVFEDDE